jgi:phospholipid/cholesterol/gamma-HCH transport system substrate-binding protein
LEEVTASLPAVLHEVSKAIEEIRPFFGEENRIAFSETLKNINTITKALAPEQGKESNIQDLIASMKQGTKEFRQMIGEMNALLTENRTSIHHFTGDGLPALTQFLKEGKETLSTIRRIGESLERSPSRFMYNDPHQGVKVP